MFLAALMRYEYLLHLLRRMIGLLRDLIYPYKYMKIITSIQTIILNEEDDSLSLLF